MNTAALGHLAGLFRGALTPSSAVPEVTAVERGAHYALLLIRHYLGAPSFLERFEARTLLASLERRSAPLGNAEYSEVERVSETALRSPEDFTRFVGEAVRPFYIEGGARRIAGIQEWTADYFASRYGDLDVPVNFPDRTNELRKLGEIVRGIQSGTLQSVYVENVSDVIGEHLELESALGVEALEARLGARYLSSQLFLGGPKSGSNFHCAGVTTIFLMVQGEKEWTFVHPRHSLWMYPRLSPASGYVASQVRHLLSPDEITRLFPLYRRVPKYRGVMREGDALVLPPYWWHAVTNLSPLTIGVSTRWSCPAWARAKQNPYAAADLAYRFSHFQRRARLEGKRRQRSGKRSFQTDHTLKSKLAHGFSHFGDHRTEPS